MSKCSSFPTLWLVIIAVDFQKWVKIKMHNEPDQISLSLTSTKQQNLFIYIFVAIYQNYKVLDIGRPEHILEKNWCDATKGEFCMILSFHFMVGFILCPTKSSYSHNRHWYYFRRLQNLDQTKCSNPAQDVPVQVE